MGRITVLESLSSDKDDVVLDFDSTTPSGFDVITNLGVGVGNTVALAVEKLGTDGNLSKRAVRDLADLIEGSAKVSFIHTTSQEGLEILRHDAAHVLAQAIKRTYPTAKLAIGPAIDSGFYYDVELPIDASEDILPILEQEMHNIVASKFRITREVWSREKAIDYFAAQNELYKVELIRSIPDGEEIKMYRQGEFIDLCEGPHSPNVSNVKHFRLLRISGAYWRGDSKGPMLTRIYGTVFASKAELDQHLVMLEEAEKRDHRKLGCQLDLFHTQNEAVGQIFWHPNGYAIYRTVEKYIRDLLVHHGYQEVKTPILVDSSLWHRSGHLEKFAENMIMCQIEDGTSVIKPMNCPCHVQIFNNKLRSYRDLPLRLSEFGMCHRNESSGSMRGLMRVRGFTQDDAHIFCSEDQVMDEIIAFCNLLFQVYKKFGFEDVKIKFSDRPEKRAGTDEIWDKAEHSLMAALKSLGKDFEINPGEGAFYGPKLEFVLKDALGRDWQCGTVQLDFVLPGRLDATFVGSDNKKHTPIMIHRAIIGTFERFIGILIEHYAGKFPFWLSPIQVCIANVSEISLDYATQTELLYRSHGFRVEADYSANKIGYKIREAWAKKIPVVCVIGEKEMNNNTVAIRLVDENSVEEMAREHSLSFLDKINN